jgi:DNA-binding NarL/FixJ family response regulator
MGDCGGRDRRRGGRRWCLTSTPRSSSGRTARSAGLPAWSRSRPEPEERPSPKLLESLSGREREVLTEVAGGWSNAEIGERLHISAATAKTHVSRLLMKLDAHDRARLVMIAYQTRLVTPG